MKKGENKKCEVKTVQSRFSEGVITGELVSWCRKMEPLLKCKEVPPYSREAWWRNREVMLVSIQASLSYKVLRRASSAPIYPISLPRIRAKIKEQKSVHKKLYYPAAGAKDHRVSILASTKSVLNEANFPFRGLETFSISSFDLNKAERDCQSDKSIMQWWACLAPMKLFWHWLGGSKHREPTIKWIP